MNRPNRSLVLATLPQFCAVCSGDGVVRLTRTGRARGNGRVRCPHCINHLPVVHLPYRTDKPRGVA